MPHSGGGLRFHIWVILGARFVFHIRGARGRGGSGQRRLWAGGLWAGGALGRGKRVPFCARRPRTRFAQNGSRFVHASPGPDLHKTGPVLCKPAQNPICTIRVPFCASQSKSPNAGYQNISFKQNYKPPLTKIHFNYVRVSCFYMFLT